MTPVEQPEEVPRLPRGRGLKLSTGALVRIAMTLSLLVVLILLQRPCANAVGKFVAGFGDQGSGGSTMPKPGTVEPAKAGSADPYDGYEHLSPNMTDQEIKAAIDRAKARATATAPDARAAGATATAPDAGATATAPDAAP